VDIHRCPRCGGPAPPYASACPWCGGLLVPLPPPPPPPPGVPGNPAADPIQSAEELTLWSGEVLFDDLFRITDPSGYLLARGVRSPGGLIAFMEVLLIDPFDQFLLAFRLRNRPGSTGVPIFSGNIPYVAVDDQGRIVGELLGKFQGWKGRSFTLWRQGEQVLEVRSGSRFHPYPVLERGSPVAVITERAATRETLAGVEVRVTGRWDLRFIAPCPHLDVVALLVHVASHRGSPGIRGG
jgi:hypothetical protein